MARAVAFLDILGFKDLLQELTLEELSSEYEKAVEQTASVNRKLEAHPSALSLLPTHKPGEPWCHRQIFSDSVVLIALDETEEACLKLLLYTRLFFIFMLVRKLPVRGAVAAGDLYHNAESSVTLGHALTNAYLMEQEQNWAGVCIADSVWDAFPNLLAQARKPESPLHYYFLEYPIPWKRDPMPAHRVLNWRFNTVIEEGSRRLLEKARIQKVPAKHENVIRYLEHVRASGAVYFADAAPKIAECPTVWIGPTEPPFKHGDDL